MDPRPKETLKKSKEIQFLVDVKPIEIRQQLIFGQYSTILKTFSIYFKLKSSVMCLNINSTILKTFPAFLLNSNVPDPTDGVTSRTGSPCAPGARLKFLAINTSENYRNGEGGRL